MATPGFAVPPNKATNSRSKIVKPILKKLSHSEKNSLDLDRVWEDHESGFGSHGLYQTPAAGRSARDVSFALGYGETTGSGGSRPRFQQHTRSTSGTSVATTGSGGLRGTTFVHPFQQTPRTATPPLSYANSIASLDTGPRDYSPTITENEDNGDFVSTASLPHHPQPNPHSHMHSGSVSSSNLRRPSLASQRTSSFTDITTAPQALRVNTGRSVPATSSRLARGSLSSSLSQSDLNLNLSSSNALNQTTTNTSRPPTIDLASPASSASYAQMSPVRSSLEGLGFPRLRSRSELDAGARAEQIREARRKFDERERRDQEKAERELLRKRERQEHKQSKEIERSLRKNSTAGSGNEAIRPTTSRKSTPTGSSRDAEKQLAFSSSNYDTVADGMRPKMGPRAAEDVRFEAPKRSNTAKQKTQGVWHGFILWLRTRLFRSE